MWRRRGGDDPEERGGRVSKEGRVSHLVLLVSLFLTCLFISHFDGREVLKLGIRVGEGSFG